MRKVRGVEGSLKGNRVLVLGLARSGAAAVRLLRAEGAAVVAADENRAVLPPDGITDLTVVRGATGGCSTGATRSS